MTHLPVLVISVSSSAKKKFAEFLLPAAALFLAPSAAPKVSLTGISPSSSSPSPSSILGVVVVVVVVVDDVIAFAVVAIVVVVSVALVVVVVVVIVVVEVNRSSSRLGETL